MWAQLEYDISSGQGPQRRNPSASPAAGAAGPAAVEGPAVTEPAAAGQATAGSATIGEGPAAGGVGPRCTCGLKE